MQGLVVGLVGKDPSCLCPPLYTALLAKATTTTTHQNDPWAQRSSSVVWPEAAWIPVPAVPANGFVTSGELLNLSRLPVLHP